MTDYKKLIDYLENNSDNDIVDRLTNVSIVELIGYNRELGNYVGWNYKRVYLDGFYGIKYIDNILYSYEDKDKEPVFNLEINTVTWNLKKTTEQTYEISKILKRLNDGYKEYLENRREELLKAVTKRRKQILSQSKSSNKVKSIKKELMNSYGKLLMENGFEVSKVANFEYSRWDYYVSERKVPDKWHKYIEVGKGIKFASVECKINNKGYTLGVKIETTGMIGCSIEDLKEAYDKLKKEYSIISEILSN